MEDWRVESAKATNVLCVPVTRYLSEMFSDRGATPRGFALSAWSTLDRARSTTVASRLEYHVAGSEQRHRIDTRARASNSVSCTHKVLKPECEQVQPVTC